MPEWRPVGAWQSKGRRLPYAWPTEASIGDDPFLVIIRRGNRFWVDLREVRTLVEVLQDAAANLGAPLALEAVAAGVDGRDGPQPAGAP